MARYIDADKFKNHIENCICEVQNTNGNSEDFKIVLRALANQPTADVKEVVYGEWKNNWISTDEDLNGYYDGNFQCSECFEVSEEPTDFCPNCGADMRGVRRK